MSKTLNLIGLYADWQTEVIWQVICPNDEEEPGCFNLNTRSSSWKSSAVEYGQQLV